MGCCFEEWNRHRGLAVWDAVLKSGLDAEGLVVWDSVLRSGIDTEGLVVWDAVLKTRWNS